MTHPMVVAQECCLGLMQLKKQSAIPKKNHSAGTPVIHFGPRGKPLTQDLAKELISKHDEFIILSSRYEGIDQRIREDLVDIEISIGDFICQGGEVPAMCFIETLSRLKPGVLGNPESSLDESFEDGQLESSQYTKPATWNEKNVPEVLTSGDHKKIAEWRKEDAKKVTLSSRPDLAFLKGIDTSRVSIALMHYPVYNKNKEVITSSITSIDVHDISRSSRTYGLKNFYVIHPGEMLRKLTEKICQHWDVGYGSTYNPNRKDALSIVKVLPDFESMLSDIEAESGNKPIIISTSAQAGEKCSSYEAVKLAIETSDRDFLILLGTGWGLTEEILATASYQLLPIEGFTEYNHLSVRAAAAITLDRLFGKPA